MVVLQTAGEAPLVRLFQVLAEQLDELEESRKAGQWTGANGLVRYFNEMGPEFRPMIAGLWDEFCVAVQNPAADQR